MLQFFFSAPPCILWLLHRRWKKKTLYTAGKKEKFGFAKYLQDSVMLKFWPPSSPDLTFWTLISGETTIMFTILRSQWRLVLWMSWPVWIKNIWSMHAIILEAALRPYSKLMIILNTLMSCICMYVRTCVLNSVKYIYSFLC